MHHGKFSLMDNLMCFWIIYRWKQEQCLSPCIMSKEIIQFQQWKIFTNGQSTVFLNNKLIKTRTMFVNMHNVKINCIVQLQQPAKRKLISFIDLLSYDDVNEHFKLLVASFSIDFTFIYYFNIQKVSRLWQILRTWQCYLNPFVTSLCRLLWNPSFPWWLKFRRYWYARNRVNNEIYSA